MIELKNSVLSISINPNGAELTHIKYNEKEYLWQGDSDYWVGQSPQLFPVIGACPEGGWDYKGKKILLGNHGFARKSSFELVEQSDDHCLLSLTDRESIKSQYPFSFALYIKYSLDHNRLRVDYLVENKGKGILPFSIGAHPGFICPLDSGLKFEDYYVQFNRREKIARRYKNEFLTGEKELLLDNSDRIDLDYRLFDRGAIIFSGLESDSVILKSDKSSHSVQMDFAGFPDFGIWTVPGKKAPYLCLEPWFGVDSSEGDSSDFEKKEGIQFLQTGETFPCSYSLLFS
ncbi:aldose 1-epimerase family protein [Spirochaeta cellobiosiphila]|uniref:aldose 1-epimerase family protein n=1 Tax=Spirochaeta cellobiosiphila TaxID=504483 RepID=UPI00040CAFEC|nr:aldose 1-epimerase family protein [Spirochaeta cellobiosiphila]